MFCQSRLPAFNKNNKYLIRCWYDSLCFASALSLAFARSGLAVEIAPNPKGNARIVRTSVHVACERDLLSDHYSFSNPRQLRQYIRQNQSVQRAARWDRNASDYLMYLMDVVYIWPGDIRTSKGSLELVWSETRAVWLATELVSPSNPHGRRSTIELSQLQFPRRNELSNVVPYSLYSRLPGIRGYQGGFEQTSFGQEEYVGMLAVNNRFGNMTFSTNPNDPENYILYQDSVDDETQPPLTIRGRILNITRGLGSGIDNVDVFILEAGKIHPHRISWRDFIRDARVDQTAMALEQMEEMRTAIREGHLPGEIADDMSMLQRPAGDIDPEIARVFKDSRESQYRNIELLNYLKSKGLLLNVDFRVALNDQSVPIPPFAIAHEDVISPRVQREWSYLTSQAILNNLADVVIFELIPGRFQVRRPARRATTLTSFLDHPESSQLISRLAYFGLRILIDPTLDINRSGGFYSPRYKALFLPVSASQTDLIHEAQHYLFSEFGVFDRLASVLADPDFRDRLRSEPRAALDSWLDTRFPFSVSERIATILGVDPRYYHRMLKHFALSGLGISSKSSSLSWGMQAINELMSVQCELSTMRSSGVSLSNPRFIAAEDYGNRWVLLAIEAIPAAERSQFLKAWLSAIETNLSSR